MSCVDTISFWCCCTVCTTVYCIWSSEHNLHRGVSTRDLVKRTSCVDTISFWCCCSVCTTVYCIWSSAHKLHRGVSTSEEISSRERVAWTPSHFGVVAVYAQLFTAFGRVHTSCIEVCPRVKRSRQENELRGHHLILVLLQCMHNCLLHLVECTQVASRCVHE